MSPFITTKCERNTVTMSMLLISVYSRKIKQSTRLPALAFFLVVGTIGACYGQSSAPNNSPLVPGSAAYRAHAILSTINSLAGLLCPGAFRHYSNAYRATYNDEYGLSNTVLPPYTFSQVRWMMREALPVPGMSIGHYCDRLGAIVGCVDRARLTSEQQGAICAEVAKILPTLPTGTDHPLPVCIAEMFANLHYYQALPEVKALLPKYSPQHDADYSWDTSEARLRSAISKLKSAKASHTGPVQGPTSRDEAPSHR